MGGHADRVPAVGVHIGKVLRRGGGVSGIMEAPQAVERKTQAAFARMLLGGIAVGHVVGVGGQAPLGKDRRIAHDPVKAECVHWHVAPVFLYYGSLFEGAVPGVCTGGLRESKNFQTPSTAEAVPLCPPCRIAVPGPASRRTANSAAAEIPNRLILPPAAAARNPPNAACGWGRQGLLYKTRRPPSSGRRRKNALEG